MSLDLVLSSPGSSRNSTSHVRLVDLTREPETLISLVEVERTTPVMPDILIDPRADELLGLVYPLDSLEMLAWRDAAEASFPSGVVERCSSATTAPFDGYGRGTELMVVRWARRPLEAVSVAQIASDAWYAAVEAKDRGVPREFARLVIWRLDRVLENERLGFPSDLLPAIAGR